MPNPFFPLSEIISDSLFPLEWFNLGTEPDIFDRIGFVDYRVRSIPEGIYFSVDLAFDAGHDRDSTVEIGLMQFPDLKVIIRALGRLEIWLQNDFKLRISVGQFSIRIPKNLLKPVQEDQNGAWVEAQDREFAEIEIDYSSFSEELPREAREHPIVLTVDNQGRLDFDHPFEREDGSSIVPVISLNGPAMIADTGIVIDAEDIAFNFDPDDPMISLGRGLLKLPANITGSVVLPEIVFQNASISRRGFSGTVTADWPLAYRGDKYVYEVSGETSEAELFGLNGGLHEFSIVLERSLITSSAICGGILLPFFDEPVDIELALSQSGGFSVIVKGVGPDGALVLTKEDLFKLKVQSLALERIKDIESGLDETSIEVSGAIQPLFYSNEGVTWPEASVEGLKVGFRNGEHFVDIKGGWIDFKDQAVLDLYGFKAELNKIGFGKEGEKLWVGATGSIRLVELLPIGASVKGLRVLWNPNLPLEQIPTSLEFDLKGIEILHTIPQTMEFKGSAYFLNEGTIKGFGGDLYLNLPTVGFSAEAGMLVGINSETPPYPFFYIYLGVELPAGIPLGQSGLALKGAKGLFGYNVFPKIEENQNWYYDWYKRAPEVGVTHSTKWYPRRNGLAFGAGVTLTTTDGYIKGIKALLAFMLPGPVIIIEGKSLILAGLQPNAEPPFRMMAILDGNRGTIQLNVEAQAELVEDVIEAYGGLEAFFNFNDVTLWHLYLGQDEPEDRRIQANLFDLFKAKAYLMLDNNKMQMGAFIGINKKFEYGLEKVPIIDNLTVKIAFDAWIEGKATLGWRPEQVEGELAMEAGIGVSIPMFSLHICAGAEVHTKSPNPFVVDTLVKVNIDLPAPIPDFKTELDFHWESPVPPPVEAPLAEISIGNDMESTGYVLTAHTNEDHVSYVIIEPDGDSGYKKYAEYSPVVPLDARPLLEFSHPINDETNCFFRDTASTGLSYLVGKFRFTPALIQVQIYEHEKNNPWTGVVEQDWKLVYTSDEVEDGEIERLKGIWLADNEPTDTSTPGARRLRLWTKSPFVHTHHNAFGGTELFEQLNSIYYEDSFLSEIALATDSNRPVLGMPRTNYIQAFLEGYPDFGICKVEEAIPHCTDFNSVTEGEKPEGFAVDGFLFAGTNLAIQILYGRQTSSPFSGPKGLNIKSSSAGMPIKRKIDDPVVFKNDVIDLWEKGDPNSLFDYLNKFELSASLSVLTYSDLYIEFPTPAAEIFLTFYKNCRLADAHVEIFGEASIQEYSDDLENWIKKIVEFQKKWLELEEKLNKAVSDDEKKNLEIDKDKIEKQIKEQFEAKPQRSQNVSIKLDELKSEKKGDTTVVAIRARDGQPIKSIKLKKECLLVKVCYIDAEEKERQDDQGAQCETNPGSLLKNELTLKTGTYYRINIKSKIDVELLDLGLPVDIEAIIRPFYDKIRGEMKTPALFTHDAFFQTNGPPSTLEPYVLWTSPQDGENPVFCSCDMAVRLNRSYIKRMFERDEHKLMAGIYDTNGRLHEDGIIDVLFEDETDPSANPPFLFPYEQDWKTHAVQNGIDGVVDCFGESDDWFRISINQSLFPQNLYELKIFGGEGGRELLYEDFRQPGFTEKIDQKKIIIFDQGEENSPSAWEVGDDESGVLKQKSNINNRDGDTSAYGTIMLFGNDNWTDYQLLVDVKTGSDESREQNAIGVVFHYQNINGDTSYYRFSMRMHPDNRFKYYRKLVRVFRNRPPETVIGIDSKTGQKIRAIQRISTKAEPEILFDTSPYEEKFKKILSAEKSVKAKLSDKKIKEIFKSTFAETADTEDGIRMEDDWKPYNFDQWYRLRIEVRNEEMIDAQYKVSGGVHIKVFLDSDLIFDLIDPYQKTATDEDLDIQPIRSGKVGLYCWGNQNAYFRNLMVKDSALLKLNFITSKFNSFRDLIESSIDEIASSIVFDTPVVVKKIDIDAINSASIGNCAATRYKTQCCEQEFKRKSISSEAVEIVKKSFDDACLALDEEFKKLADNLTSDETTGKGELKLTQLLFTPVPETLKIYRLVNESQETTGFFLRSPEPIDWMEVIAIGENQSLREEKKVGRVTLKISTSENQKVFLIYNSDKTQAIFLFKDRHSNDHLFTFLFEMTSHVDCPQSIMQWSATSFNEAKLTYKIIG